MTQDFRSVVDIIKNGGLTQEQREGLERAYRFALLTNSMPYLSSEGTIKSYDVDIRYHQGATFAMAFNRLDRAKTEDFLFIAEDRLYRALKAGEKPDTNYRWNFETFDDLWQSGDLASLKELIEKGWDSWGVYDDDPERVKKVLAKAKEMSADQAKVEWVRIFEHALTGEQKLSLMGVDYYESAYENREQLTNVLAFLNALPKITEGASKNIIKRTSDGKIAINFNELNYLVGNLIGKEDLSSEDKEFLETAVKLMRYKPLPAGEYYDSYKPRPFKIEGGDLPLIGYLALNKNRLDDLYSYDNATSLVEELFINKIPVNGDILKSLLAITAVKALPPEAIWQYLSFADKSAVTSILNALPEEFVGTLSEKDQTFIRFARALPPVVAHFLMQRKDNIDEFVQNSLPTQRFLEELASEPDILDNLQRFIQTQTFDHLPWPQRVFWSYVKNVPQDMFKFLFEQRESFSSYITEQGVDDNAVKRDFVREIRARPENCTTYESLTELFQNLQEEHPRGDELGMIYLRITEAHRIRPIGAQRTEVEAVERLRETFSALYHADMTPFEKLSWKILQRHLPFTANEQVRGEMRQKALDVEILDIARLEWVHQSVHNYASLLEVDYLRAFNKFLETGEKQDLDGLRSKFTGNSQAPDYTDEDRQALLAIPTLTAELDQLIDSASRFYEVRPENLALAQQAGIPRALFGEPTFTRLFEDIVGRDLPALNEAGALQHFCLNVGRLRENILALSGQEITLFDKARALVLDTMLDDISQKAFVKYKDVFEEKRGVATPQDVFGATAVLREAITAAFYNGELPEEAYRRSALLTEFARGDVVTPELLHRARLLLPVIKHEVDSYWQRFTAAARPEMVKMLVRTGLSQQEAEQRVFFTDLVEFRKSSTTFVVEPLINLVEKELARITQHYTGPSMATVYEDILGGNMFKEEAQENHEVAAFIQKLSQRTMPADLNAAKAFLDDLSTSQEAHASGLASWVVQDFIDKETLQKKHVKIERNGQTIELYPLSYYGVDMAVILVNGKRIENPKDFLLKTFSIPQVAINSLREGD